MSMNRKIIWFALNAACCGINLAIVAFGNGSHFNSFVAGISATVTVIYALDIWESAA